MPKMRFSSETKFKIIQKKLKIFKDAKDGAHVIVCLIHGMFLNFQAAAISRLIYEIKTNLHGR